MRNKQEVAIRLAHWKEHLRGHAQFDNETKDNAVFAIIEELTWVLEGE